ncbi:DUF7024 domain-containing protein [Rhizobium tubonense]|uniref:DUF7024 domain-containing protein n=1 Tax=Rhizobium tubonense TaxID=484088 RepID=A0A2W4CQD6_9HYPH|nr:hypothetical protein [Rhizobium tubonense]PZM14872.1 hypothetical protein CPY51_09250 [Rhizobium tubonense]
MPEVLTTILKAGAWTLAAITISLLISILGALTSSLVKAAGVKVRPLSIVEQFAIGFIAIFVLSWYNFELGGTARGLFQIILAIITLFLAGIFVGRKNILLRNVSEFLNQTRIEAKVLLAFSFYLFAVLLYVSHSVAQEDLNIQIINNNDIHSYVASADFLLNRDRIVQKIGNIDFNVFPKSDVFGAFIFLAFSAFMLNDSPVHATMIPMAIACASAATAVFGMSRKVFHLDGITSISLGFFLLCNILFQYICLNYFLSQVMACAALLLTVFFILDNFVHRSDRLDISFMASVTGLHTVCMIFIYPVMALPHFIILTLLSCSAATITALKSNVAKSRLRLTVSIALKCTLSFALTAAVSILFLAPERFLIAVIKTLKLAVPNIAGWPLEPVGPLALLGYPESWPPRSPGPQTYIEWVGLFIIVGVGLLGISRSGQNSRSKQAQGISLGLFAFLSAGYILIALFYGPSYQQWKFAGSYPVLFSFCVPAAILIGAKKLSKAQMFAAAKVVLVIGVVAQFSYVAARWQFVRFSSAFESLSGIDEISSSNSVYIDLPAYADRMLATNYIKTKSIQFHGATYYGPGSKLEDLRPGTLALRRDRESCYLGSKNIELKGGFFLTTNILPTMAPGDLVQFSKPDSCLYTEGVSDNEPWGSWTENRNVRLAFHLSNPPDHDLRLTMKVRPFLSAGKVDRQRVDISLSGSPLFQATLSAADPISLSMQIPRQRLPANMVDIRIELPDATTPASVSESSDTRLLGLGLISLEVD